MSALGIHHTVTTMGSPFSSVNWHDVFSDFQLDFQVSTTTADHTSTPTNGLDEPANILPTTPIPTELTLHSQSVPDLCSMFCIGYLIYDLNLICGQISAPLSHCFSPGSRLNGLLLFSNEEEQFYYQVQKTANFVRYKCRSDHCGAAVNLYTKDRIVRRANKHVHRDPKHLNDYMVHRFVDEIKQKILEGVNSPVNHIYDQVTPR